MAKKLYEETNIYNIACALREKCGDESKTYKTCDMADAIRALDAGGDDPGLNDFSGKSLNYLGMNDQLNHIIDYYGDEIIMENMKGPCAGLFYNCDNLVEPKFDIYWSQSQTPSTTTSLYGTPFTDCRKLKRIPYLYYAWGIKTEGLFSGNNSLREIPDYWANTWQGDYCLWNGKSMFSSCYSLRKVPEWVNIRFTEYPASSYSNMFSNCSSLDEVVGLPLLKDSSSNYDSNIFSYCYRLKRFTFAVNEDGTPKTYIGGQANIKLNECGYCNDTYSTYITNHNSGITANKKVIDDATYQLLKDDPDWWSTKVEYSRYNKLSAIETINSLPDASANTSSHIIVFNGEAGSLTDGGAINTMTEEEIAVAAAKGWTVSFS